MKSFVGGTPEVRIALNEDFIVGQSNLVSQGRLANSYVKVKSMETLKSLTRNNPQMPVRF